MSFPFPEIPIIDSILVLFFLLFWLGYEPLLGLTGHPANRLRRDMGTIRQAWIHTLLGRDNRLLDSNLIGHTVQSAGFFASANLLLLAAMGGAIFTGGLPVSTLESLGVETASNHLLTIKLLLIMACLTRGLLDFIWALRQINYTAAAIGAVPEVLDDQARQTFSQALGHILESSMSSFSQGVRSYYFALAAASWLIGPWAFLLGTLGMIGLLMWRQTHSSSARGLKAFSQALNDNNCRD
jgi:uncharacterized membrane protein